MHLVLVRPSYSTHLITPPLGLGYLASYLQQRGHQATILDGLILGTSAVLKKITEIKPDLVGISCLTSFLHQTVELTKILKERGYPVVLGGPHPSALPRETLESSGADWVVIGEGELALAALADHFGHSGSGEQIPAIEGLYSLGDFQRGRPLSYAQRVENLDELPFPDWQQIHPRRYPLAPHGALVRHYPIGIITTSRGCPCECSFCASPGFYQRRIRFRSPENVLKEMEYLIEVLKVKEIHFEDDNLTLQRERLEKICQGILSRQWKIPWACPNGVRADRVTPELLQLMVRSGNYCLAFGIESADPQVLKNVRKGETLEQIEQALRWAQAAGIITQGFFIFGLPGETVQSIDRTIKWALEAPLDRAQFLILDILPGCQLWSELAGKFVPNFAKKSYKAAEWAPPGLTAQDLTLAQQRAFRRFYLRPRQLGHILRHFKWRQFLAVCHRLIDFPILSHR
jgi:anaerobic magnesium-protoporphyrin IX monomethyl ester cyclase